MKVLMSLLMLCFILACSETDDLGHVFLECSITSDYKRYNGEEINCQFHYYRTEYDNQEFIELHSRCADLVRPFVISENCEDICETGPYDENSPCGKYLSGRILKEILLIKD